MEMKYISIPFEMKNTKEDEKYFYFEGYGSTFGNIDLGDDIVARGAFTESLKQRKPKLLWQHKINEPMGIFTEVYEDEKGLFVRGKMPKEDNFVSGRVIPQMKIGSVDSMSIGFRTIITEWDKEDEVRTLKKVDLFEISLVTIPMNPAAVVTGMKTVVPFQNLPLTDKDIVWDASAAKRRIREFTDSSEKPNAKYKKAFLWYDATNEGLFGAYKLPIADVVDGKLKANPRAIFASAGAMRGARGGVDIPEADREGVINNINKYYKKMDLESPFSKSIEEEIAELKSLKDINNYLKFYGLSKTQTEGIMAKMREVIKQGKPDGESKSHEDNIVNLIEANINDLNKLNKIIKEN